jgi:hypothetical protein
MNEGYFEKLAEYSRNLLNRLPISKEVKPLDFTLDLLSSAIKEQKGQETKQIEGLWCEKAEIQSKRPEYTGLNTIGLLSDRFTILLIKEWFLRHRYNNPSGADKLVQTQTKDIMKAMASANPGNSSINSKISNKNPGMTIKTWECAFYNLLGINLMLWESQEVLYTKDINILSSNELREYIHWFSKGNLERNVLIEQAEHLFWRKIKGK